MDWGYIPNEHRENKRKMQKENVRISCWSNFQTADSVAIHLSFIMQARPHRQKKRGIHDWKNGKKKRQFTE